MRCKKCGSENCSVQVVTENSMKSNRHSCLYWITIGWFVQPMLWLFFTIPMLILAIFRPKKYKMKSRTKKIAVCNVCGYSWKI